MGWLAGWEREDDDADVTDDDDDAAESGLRYPGDETKTR
jgi:hypothetical protein